MNISEEINRSMKNTVHSERNSKNGAENGVKSVQPSPILRNDSLPLSHLGYDATPIKTRYDPQLKALRTEIDVVSSRKANAELDAKRAECDTMSMKKQIDFINQLIALENNRAAKLRQLLEGIRVEIEALGSRFRDRDDELKRNRDEIGLLQESLSVKKDEYDREARTRVKIQNDLQTIEEEIAFLKAIHEEERNALNSVTSLTSIDDGFYETQLSITINLIRRDFEKLSSERRQQLEGNLEKLYADMYLNCSLHSSVLQIQNGIVHASGGRAETTDPRRQK